MRKLETTGWQVCIHDHSTEGSLPEWSDLNGLPWQDAELPFDSISWASRDNVAPVGLNDQAYRWTEDVDWVLRKEFSLSAEDLAGMSEVHLVLNRVDCYFEVYLNERHLGSGANQFREHVFDLDDELLRESNVLIIYFRSPTRINAALEAVYGQLPAEFDPSRVHSRRCQAQTGWNFTPRLSTVSLLDPPELRQGRPVEIAAIHAYPGALPEVAVGQELVHNSRLQVVVDINSRRRGSGTINLHLVDDETGDVVASAEHNVTLKPKLFQVRAALDVETAKLWWSLGLGGQALYRLEVELNATDRLDQQHNLNASCMTGFRTLSIEQRKDERGESFTPMLNGHPVFCRGANWVPLDMLPARAEASDYGVLINAVIGAGMNCLRVWGGGVYERDGFYNLCDQAGILVWQDFMFANAAYPTYRAFLDEVEAEAIYQVQRLRNHPSLMLFCGNSENEWMHQMGSLKKGTENKIIGEHIWSHLLRAIVEDHAPAVFYHHSSPFGRNRHDYNDENSGDRHNNDVWDNWQDGDWYLADHGRFISSFGVHALPSRELLNEHAPGADDLNHPALRALQKMDSGLERMVRYVAAHDRIPADLDTWITSSQTMQAELSRLGAEHWRRQRFDTAGALLWHLHDSRPAVSASIIDYQRKPKTAWQASRRFFAPVLLSAELLIDDAQIAAVPYELWPENKLEENTARAFDLNLERPVNRVTLRFVVVNDTSLELDGELEVKIDAGSGQSITLENTSASVAPNELITVLTHDIDPSFMQYIRSATVRARLILSDDAENRLQVLGENIRNRQQSIGGEYSDHNTWSFDAMAGLALEMSFVEPKYYKEPDASEV